MAYQYRTVSCCARIAAISLLFPALAAAPIAASADNTPGRQSGSLKTAAYAQGREKRLTLTFSSLDVRTVLDQISSYAHVDVLMTPGAKGIISVNIRDRSADEAIRLVTAVAGLTVVKVGGAYIVGPADEASKAAAEFGQVVMIPLKYITPADAAAGLSKLAPKVSVQQTKSAIIISGLADDVALARSVIPNLDVAPAPVAPPAPESRVISLAHADAAATERIVKEAFPDVKSSVQDRAIIVNGAPADLDLVAKAIQNLDVEPPVVPEPTEVLVYRLKYLNAQKTEEVVKKAFPKVTVSAGPEANAPPAAQFNPLSSIFSSIVGTQGANSTSSTTTTTAATQANSAQGVVIQPLSRPTQLMVIGAKSDVAEVRQMLEQTDVPQPIVRIEAVLLEVDLSDVKNLGITWDFTNTGFSFTEPAGSNVTFGTLQRSSASFATSLQALVTTNKAKILASPNISVVDNEDASIFIGDELRFLGGTISSPNVGTIQSVETLPVGVALLMRPRIHPDGSVTLKVHPVISTVTGTTDGLPQTSSREADTTVRLQEGEQLVIGGLDQTNTSTVQLKVPILGDIPILGEFFRSRTHSVTKTEVVILLRAYASTTEAAPVHDFRKGDVK